MNRRIILAFVLFLFASCLFINVSSADNENTFSADRLTDIPFENMKTDKATKEKVVAYFLINLNSANSQMVKSILNNIGNGTCTIGYMPIKNQRAILVYISTHDMYYQLFYFERDKICKYTAEENKYGSDTLKDVNLIGQDFVENGLVEDCHILNIGNMLYDLLDLNINTSEIINQNESDKVEDVSQNELSKPEIISGNNEETVENRCFRTISSLLKNPSSAKLGTCVVATDNSNKKTYLLLNISAQNSFGGTVEESYFVVYDDEKAKMSVVSFDGSVNNPASMKHKNKMYAIILYLKEGIIKNVLLNELNLSSKDIAYYMNIFYKSFYQ